MNIFLSAQHAARHQHVDHVRNLISPPCSHTSDLQQAVLYSPLAWLCSKFENILANQYEQDMLYYRVSTFYCTRLGFLQQVFKYEHHWVIGQSLQDIQPKSSYPRIFIKNLSLLYKRFDKALKLRFTWEQWLVLTEYFTQQWCRK